MLPAIIEAAALVILVHICVSMTIVAALVILVHICVSMTIVAALFLVIHEIDYCINIFRYLL